MVRPFTGMHEVSKQPRAMRTIDWLVVSLVGCAVVLPAAIASTDPEHRQLIERAATILAFAGCALLLSWMWFADGAHSNVWRWLPPFWPWSRYLTSTVSRWCLVVLLVLGTITSIVLSR